ncbi:MAG: tRNA pseudouridine(38-40) synthase TruA [Beijerinckiaceae bacterium]|nr:tRNA pseudouridine(38-40) synthase TruA [Beijerinckiaceae bacterium]
MPRYKITIEYDGTPFVGWQRQNNGLSIQQALERAVTAMSGETIVVHGAGRTDAGVHAHGQVAHIDLSRHWREDVIRDAINAHIRPHPISVIACTSVADEFEARFSAVKRHYLYVILNRRAPPALDRHQVWHVARRLDGQAMHDAAQCLTGKHDFTTFRSTECQARSPIRTLDRLDVTCTGERIEIHASALSFLHNQIRSIAGSLEHVGSGKWTKDDLVSALEARNRMRCGVVAPPQGLSLIRVDY